MRSLRVTAKRVQWSASPGYHIGNSAGTPTAIFIRVDEPQDHGNSMMKLAAKGSRRNKFTFWRERRAGRCEAPRRRRCRTSSRSGNKADARPPPRPWGPAAKCEVISARALRSTWWTQSSQIGQVLYHGRDGHATKPSWHGRLAREDWAV